MKLTEPQLEQFDREGYLFYPIYSHLKRLHSSR